MGVRSEFLSEWNVVGVPVKEEDEGCVNEPRKDGGVEDGLPHRSGGENSFATEEEVDQGWTGLDGKGA